LSIGWCYVTILIVRNAALAERESAELHAAIAKQNAKLEAHEVFVKAAKEQKDLITTSHRNKDKDGTSEQLHQTLDVSPGDHTVVEL
jgi:hypothetical protein